MKENRSKLKAAFGRLGRIHLIVLECVAVALLVGSAYAAVAFSGGGTNPGTGGESASLPQEDHQTGLSPASQEETAWNAASSGLPQEETSLSLPEESGINASQLQTELLQTESGPVASSGAPELEPAPFSQQRYGLLWKDTQELRAEVARADLALCSTQGDVDSSVSLDQFKLEDFFALMETLQTYEWMDYGEVVNPFLLNAYWITVSNGDNTILTQLVFARDEGGKCFAWSSEDQKIVYLTDGEFVSLVEFFGEIE